MQAPNMQKSKNNFKGKQGGQSKRYNDDNQFKGNGQQRNQGNRFNGKNSRAGGPRNNYGANKMTDDNFSQNQFVMGKEDINM